MVQRPLRQPLLLDNISDDNPKKGDLIEIQHFLYSHWAVYIGDGYIAHLLPEQEVRRHFMTRMLYFLLGVLPFKLFGLSLLKIHVLKEKLLHIAVTGRQSFINNTKDERFTPYSPDDIVNIVQLFLLRRTATRYNLVYKNCEHFASYCRYGIEISDQAKMILTWIVALVATYLNCFAAFNASLVLSLFVTTYLVYVLWKFTSHSLEVSNHAKYIMITSITAIVLIHCYTIFTVSFTLRV